MLCYSVQLRVTSNITCNLNKALSVIQIEPYLEVIPSNNSVASNLTCIKVRTGIFKLLHHFYNNLKITNLIISKNKGATVVCFPHYSIKKKNVI